MAAAVFHGFRGNVEWGDASLSMKITSWTINATADIHGVTGMEATNVSRQKLLGLVDWTATVEGAALAAGPEIAEGAEAALEMWLTRTFTDGILYGNAILMSYTVTQDQSDAGRITLNFQGSGALDHIVTDP